MIARSTVPYQFNKRPVNARVGSKKCEKEKPALRRAMDGAAATYINRPARDRVV